MLSDTPPTIYSSGLYAVPTNASIIVPCASMPAYRADSYWGGFNNYVDTFEYSVSVTQNNSQMGNAIVTQQPNCSNGAFATVTVAPNAGYQFVNWTKENTIVSTDAVYTFTVTEDVELVANFAKQDFTFIGSETDHNWSTASNWNTGMLPTAADDVVIDGQCNLDQDASVNTITINGGKSLTILSGHKLTATEVVSNEATCLIVNDGGQLFTQTENTVYATVKKGIAAYTGIRDNYYFVAPAAFTEPNQIETNTTNMLSGEYDLYWFDQFSPTEEWQNYEASPFSYLYMKKGYLYANSANTTLTFAGKLVTTEAEDVGLDYEGEESVFSGFTLIGNPYPCNATVSGKYLVEDAYYVINEASGRENIIVTTNPVVAPCTGLFAVAANEDAVVTFAPTTENATVRGSQNFIRMESFDSQNQLEDRVYVKIGEGNGLQKFNLDAQSTQLYFSRNGKDFAVIPSNGNSEMTVNFTTKDYGRHTISVCPENISCDYLHLIDNLTGSDVDVLSDANSYTFEASPSDYAARFKLVFNVTGVEENAASTSSAYVSNGNLVIDHIEDEAMLQIIDMTGRIVSSETVSGSYNKALNLNAGLYIINLNGSTQKIVVR